MASVSDINLTEYMGRKVRVTLNDRDEVVEGKVEAANDDKSGGMLLVKLKGKSSTDLLLRAFIKEVDLVEFSDDDLGQSKLKPVKLNGVRRHLLNYHGWTLSKVNQLDDAEAMVQHAGLHEAPESKEIGHYHADKEDENTSTDES